VSDAHYLTSRNIKDQKAVNEAVRAHLRFKQRFAVRKTTPEGLPRVVIAQANIANGASGNAAIAQGAVGSLTASSKIVSVLNLTGSQINSGSTFVAARVAIANSAGGAWVAMLGASGPAVTIERVYYGTAEEDIPAGGSGDVTSASAPNGEGATVSCLLHAAHGGEKISQGKSLIYIKRVDGTRLIIAVECEDNPAPAPPSNPTLSSLSPADGATGVAGTVTLSWTSDGDSWDVYFGVPGNLTRYPVTSTSFDPPGTLPAGQYVWQVVAYNDDGGSTVGSYLVFTV